MLGLIGWLLSAAIPAVPLVWVTGGAATSVALAVALVATVVVLASLREPRRAATGQQEVDLPRSASADSQLPNAA
jgi:hypothetical protein